MGFVEGKIDRGVLRQTVYLGTRSVSGNRSEVRHLGVM